MKRQTWALTPTERFVALILKYKYDLSVLFETYRLNVRGRKFDECSRWLSRYHHSGLMYTYAELWDMISSITYSEKMFLNERESMRSKDTSSLQRSVARLSSQSKQKRSRYKI
jgi:hypothetical protein